jgi:hypothetical protein
VIITSDERATIIKYRADQALDLTEIRMFKVHNPRPSPAPADRGAACIELEYVPKGGRSWTWTRIVADEWYFITIERGIFILFDSREHLPINMSVWLAHVQGRGRMLTTRERFLRGND